MTNFDTGVAPVLHRIRAEANVVEDHARRVETDVKDLPARPQWVTKAEDELAEAEKALLRALINVRAARQHYQKVKVEQV